MSGRSSGEIEELLRDATAQTVGRMFDETPEDFGGAAPGGESWPLYLRYRGREGVGRALLAKRGNPSVFEAAAFGLNDELEALLARDQSMANQAGPDGHFPLGLASYFGQAETAKILIDAGAEVDRKSANGQSVAPVHAAAASGSIVILQYLLEHEAEAGARQQGGNTALHSVAMRGDREACELLLAHSAEAGAMNDKGETAAVLASRSGHAELAKWLHHFGSKAMGAET